MLSSELKRDKNLNKTWTLWLDYIILGLFLLNDCMILFSIWVKILVGPGIDLLCHKTTSKYAKEGIIKILIVAGSLQYLLPILFMGKILYKATNSFLSYNFSFTYHITISSAYMEILFAINWKIYNIQRQRSKCMMNSRICIGMSLNTRTLPQKPSWFTCLL